MASTTLMTFMLRAPSSTRFVDLFGSWDNFSRPYAMERDLRMGSGHWRGCHSFVNIVCDGDSLQATPSRDGGLKMGGVYWYFYQLNGDVDFHDPAEPSTTSCPFLPGQEVNILEVPIQAKPARSYGRRGSSSSTASMAYTLNPEDKYLTPKPSVRTRSRDQDIEVSSLERSHNESTVRSKTFPETRLSCDSPIRPVTVIRATSCISTSDRHSSYSEPPVRRKPFWASLGRLRQVRSAGTDRRIEELYQGCPSEPGTETGTSCSRSADSFEFSKGLNSARTISRISRVTPNSNGAPKEHSAPFVEQKIANSSLCPDPASLTHLETVEDKGHGAMPLNELSKQVRDLCREQTPVRPDDSSQTPGGRVNDLETSTLNLYEPISLAHYEAQEQKPWRTQLGDEYPDQPGALSSIELGDQFDLSSSTTCDLERQLSVSDSSYSSSDIFSPSSSSATAYSNCMSPFHLSQPETPTTGEFEEYSLGFSLGKITTSLLPTCEEDDAGLQDLPSGRAQSNTAHLNISGFQGYTQPKEEYGSALTLRNLSPKSSRGEPSLDQKSGQNLVESWNDGVEDRIAAMDDLLDDLSYLGGMIA